MEQMGQLNLIKAAEENLMHTYNRYQIVLDHGEGVHLYDVEGNKYLDFGAGIAVFALGYGNKEYNDALKGQIDKLLHTSNYFYNEPAIDAAKKFLEASKMDRVFFTSSGTEAIEGALKLARKYYYKKHGVANSEVISMNHSFHGRSMGALSITGTKKYREAFEPLIGGTVFAEYNNLEDVKSKISNKTAAIIMETVQGEGGLYPADTSFIMGVRKLCDEHRILLILDEIQCGMGRCGTMFAFEQYGIKPDIMTSAKALGCGVPVGAFAATNAVSKAFEPGDHGTTYGGNPLVCAAITKVFDLYEKEQILANVNEVGTYLKQELDKLVEEYDCIKERRGIGLMQGLEFTKPVKEIIEKAMKQKLIIFSAGANVIRFVPPLIITKQHVDEMISIIKKCI